MATLVTFSVRRNLQLEEGQVDNLLTKKASGWWGWLHLTLVTFSLRRNLQLKEDQVNNLLTEETFAG